VSESSAGPDKPSAETATPEGGFTSVAAGATLEGRLEGSGVVVVQGTFEGAMELDGELVVPAGGVLTGDPTARAGRIRVEGEVRGRVEAESVFEALAGSRVDGEVRAPIGRIDPGALTSARVLLGPGDPGAG
jgi:cytoskeletal protein CcmA (bactofilin family)